MLIAMCPDCILQGRTALHEAASAGHSLWCYGDAGDSLRAVTLLLAHGADVNTKIIMTRFATQAALLADGHCKFLSSRNHMK